MRGRLIALGLMCSACVGLGDFEAPSCDRTGKTQPLERLDEVRALAAVDAPAGSAFVLQASNGEPRALARLSRQGVWEQHAIEGPTWCRADVDCKLRGLALAALADEYVLAITLQPSAAACSQLRLALADQWPEPMLRGGDAPGSLFHGVRLDERGCTRGGAQDARLAALDTAPTRDVLLVWRATEPALAEGPCGQVGDGYIMALGVSAPQDGFGLFSDERESLRCLGVSARAPRVIASKRARGYFVAFADAAALRVQFVPAYGEARAVVESAVWPLSDEAPADRLGLALSADERQLALSWSAGERVWFAAFDVAPDLTLTIHSQAELPTHGKLAADPLALRVDTGLLDWSSYQSDAGWLYLWMSESGVSARLYGARISDRTGKPLGGAMQLADGPLSMPLVSNGVSGGIYGFVRNDKTHLTMEQPQLEVHSTQCAIAARL